MPRTRDLSSPGTTLTRLVLPLIAAALLLSGCGGGGSGVSAVSDKATIAVDFSHAVAAKSMVGFLHSMDTAAPADAYITPLQPRLWRTGTLTPQIYPRTLELHTGFVLVCSDYWGYDPAKLPPSDFTAYQAEVKQLAQQHTEDGLVFDIWNEPNTSLFWSSSLYSYFQAFKIAHDAIRQVKSNALITGPSYSSYDHSALQLFLNFCLSHDIKLDVLSWHEFPSGDQIPSIQSHLQEARRDFLNNAKYAALGIKSIQINEATVSQIQCLPASSLAVLDSLERGGADASAHACWDDPDGGSNCNSNSLDGLLTEGGGSPRAVWWAYKAYAAGVSSRVVSTSTNDRFVTMASRASDTPAPQLIVGMYQGSHGSPFSGTATLVFNHLSSAASLTGAANVRLTISTIPSSGSAALPALPAPTTMDVPVQNDSATATLPVGLEQAYVVSLSPA